MIVLSSLEYGCNVYGAAQLKRLESIHNQGFRIAIGVFCINKTWKLAVRTGNVGLELYSRMIKAAITAVMRTTLTYTEEYDNYAVVRPKLTKPYPIRALDTSASLNMDCKK
jgi:hypothetical protein